jgi:hypothetical protein
VNRKSIAKTESGEALVVAGRNGCRRCNTVGAIIHRAVYENQQCRSQECLCEAILTAVHRELRYRRVYEFAVFERLVVDPTDMAVHIVEEMLSRDGRISVSELRSFLEKRVRGDGDARSISALTAGLNAFVHAKMRWAIARAHREMNPEMRKIRRGVWKFFSGNIGYMSYTAEGRTLYHQSSVLHTPTAVRVPEIGDLVAELLASGQHSYSIPSDVESIFGVLIARGIRAPALSAGMIAATIRLWNEYLMHDEVRTTCDAEYESVRYDSAILMERTIASLVAGRLRKFVRDSIHTEAECGRLVNAVRGYLRDYIAESPRRIGDYWEEAFPGSPFECLSIERARRFRNLLQHARSTLRRMGKRYYVRS